MAEQLEEIHHLKVNAHYGLATPLGNVAILCSELDLPLLSVRVQYKGNAAQKTASGFYVIACELNPEYSSMEPAQVRSIELQRTRDCEDWSDLLQYLGEDVEKEVIPIHTVVPAIRTPKKPDVKPIVYPDELPDGSREYQEGTKKMVQINTYERNPSARAACIEHYGARCCICGFDFGKVYGKEFDGMIHVHHIQMISKMDGIHHIDPIQDLRPVCPNCHMILHSKSDRYTLDDVQQMLQKNKS
ncbi:MAG: HNH endonuclease [Rikenellaceae bacterium]